MGRSSEGIGLIAGSGATDWRLIGRPLSAGATAGVKVDAGKSPLAMGVLNYFPHALLAVAEVSAYGIRKYDLRYEDRNYMKVSNGVARYSDALGRHLVMEAIHPLDKESGLHHDAMAAWNALARLELRLHDINILAVEGRGSSSA